VPTQRVLQHLLATLKLALYYMGVFVTREHVRHNKSGIAHRGRTRINHLRELPSVKPLCSGGQVTLPSRTGEPQVYLRNAGCRDVGEAASST
jgi:hypothetical protein